MSPRLGPLSYGHKDDTVFLGRDFAAKQEYSEQTALEIDQEVRRIVTENYQRAKDLLVEHREQLERVARALLEYEVLDGSEVDSILAGEAIRKAVPTPPPTDATEEGVPGEKEATPGKGLFVAPAPFLKEDPEEA
jgi:cell division protease FtsH